ncbi:Leucine-responsive regulatory protein [Ascidiaceihabitans donghaensis]|uniref:Leucine-responsive regulatory protein n=2 Tax=Ascidiaceihabitans donghaensis TaxID=1510460 RepID=A0A2R8BFH5_9RHOB|nr:Leucine-responsive regulatory protein [Ascidiaceihabitans donghaensis]
MQRCILGLFNYKREKQFAETIDCEIFMLDDLDRRILRQWQADPSLSPSELAQKCGVSMAKLARRQGRLQDAGIVKGVQAEIDWTALGYSVEVSLRVTLDKTVGRAFEDFFDAARLVPEVIEMQTFLGRVDVRLSVIARDMGHYQHIYRDRILTLPGITDIEALMQVALIKSNESLPL